MIRGLYVSILTDKIGSFTLPNIAKGILGNATKEAQFIGYVFQYGFNSVSIYDLGKILPSQSLSSRLSNLIKQLKANGVVEVNAIASTLNDVDLIKRYNASHQNHFDGVVTELEFWNAGNGNTAVFNSALALLDAIRVSKLVASCYIGWLNLIPGMAINAAASILANHADRILVHAYVKDPSLASGYILSRVTALRAGNPNVDIRPIFSAEGVGFSAGDEIFMGDYLKTHTFTQCEAALPGFSGYQYYEYGFLRAIK